MEGFDDAIGALEEVVARCAVDQDRAGYFPAMYLAVTRTVRDRAAAGRFEDAARMGRFVAHFASRYLDAERAWRTDQPAPMAWAVSFDAAQRWRPVILQHLLLGINAHINLDLGVTASSVRGDGPVEAVRADFEAINDVLGELVEGCQGALGEVSPWLAWCDRVGGSRDEALINFSLRRARAQAWSLASRLSTLEGAPLQAAIAEADRAAASVGLAVARPGLWPSAVLLAVRLGERAAPAEVMALLAAVAPRPD